MATPLPPRPAWVPGELYPFADRYADVAGCTVHYVDEGSGPPLLLLHGNPEQLVRALGLHDVTMMVQDWGGPIGFAVATRNPERFAAFVVGNTWAWPKNDVPTQVFSRLLGGPIGRRLILNRNLFVEAALGRGVRGGVPDAVMEAYRGPFPTPGSRGPTAVFPREILASRPFLAEIERGLPALRNRPALIVWPTRDPAFKARERERWEQLFADHRTVVLEGAGHYIQEEAPNEIVNACRAWRPAV